MSRRTKYSLNLKKKRYGIEIKPNSDLLDDNSVEYVIYARKSTDDDVNQKQSIPDQIKACLYFVEKNKERGGKQIKIMQKNELYEKYFRNGLDDIKEEKKLDISDYRFYKEIDDLFIIRESASAKNVGRPKRNALIKLVKEGKIKGILSYSPDRQARNMIDGGLLIELATDGKVKLVYTNFLFENSPSGRMMLGIWFVYSKFYSDNLSHITTRGNISATEKGKAIGSYKHGYNINEQGQYVPNERFGVIRQAFEAKIYTNATNKEIAEGLSAAGYLRVTKVSKREVTYDGDNVGNRRTDPFYCGMLFYGDLVSTELKDKYDFKPMIDMEEHGILCNKYLQDRRGVKIKNDETDLSFILDPFEKQFVRNNAGKVMSMYISKKNEMQKRIDDLILSGKKFRYIDVVPKSYLRFKAEGKHEISYKEIEPQIIKRLEGIKIKKEDYDAYYQYIKQDFDKKNEVVSQKRKVFEKHKSSLQDEKTDYISKSMSCGAKDEEEKKAYKEKRAHYDEEIKKVQQFLDELIYEENTEPIEYESFVELLTNAAKYYTLGDIVRRRKIISILSPNLVIHRDNTVTIRVYPQLESLMGSMVGDEGFEPTTPSV